MKWVLRAVALLAIALLAWWAFQRISAAEGARRDALARADSALAQSGQAWASRDTALGALRASRDSNVVLIRKVRKETFKTDSVSAVNDSLLQVLESDSIAVGSSPSDSVQYYRTRANGFKDLLFREKTQTAALRGQILARDFIIDRQQGAIDSLFIVASKDSVRISTLEKDLKDLRDVAVPRCLLGLIECPSPTTTFLIGVGVGGGASLLVNTLSGSGS